MQHNSFLVRSHFQIYDKIIPIFRLVCVGILIEFAIKGRLAGGGKSIAMLGVYLLYTFILLLSKNIRELFVLKYPFVIGVFETLLATFGVACSGSSLSPFYFSYILMISFYGIIYNLGYSIIVSSFSSLCFLTEMFLLEEKITSYVIIQVIFLWVFAFFIGIISGKISKYNIDMAIYDHLTMLYNRQYFYGQLEYYLLQSKNSGFPLCLVIMDVNDFKQINDQKGHLEGDRILAELGNLLKETIQKGEIAARYGGDEFVLLLPNTGKDKAEDFCSRMEECILKSSAVEITVSIGYAISPNDGENEEELFHVADMAMYRSKTKQKEKKHITISEE